MQRRNNQIIIRLDDDELAKFKRRVAKSGLSQSAYIRFLIGGLAPQDQPPPDYHAMMRELADIGETLTRIAVAAYKMHHINTEAYAECALRLDNTILKIMEAVTLPRRME